jgi:hypothetical protein
MCAKYAQLLTNVLEGELLNTNVASSHDRRLMLTLLPSSIGSAFAAGQHSVTPL